MLLETSDARLCHCVDSDADDTMSCPDEDSYVEHVIQSLKRSRAKLVHKPASCLWHAAHAAPPLAQAL